MRSMFLDMGFRPAATYGAPGALHTHPLSLRGSLFLGQGGPENRLLGVRTATIIARCQLATLLGGWHDTELDPDRVFEMWKPTYGTPWAGEAWRAWSPEEARTLAGIRNDPRPAELEDLGLVDGFFTGPAFQWGWRDLPYNHKYCCEPETSQEEFRRRSFGGKPPPHVPGDPFFCPKEAAVPEDPFIARFTGSREEFFRIDRTAPWGQTKQAVLNSVTMVRALVGYPFPGPISFDPTLWYEAAQPDLERIVKLNFPVPEDFARMAVTLSVVTTYDAVAQQEIARAKREARQARREGVIRAVMSAVVGGLVSFAAPALVASVISGIQSVGTAAQKAQTARDLAKVAQAFEAGDAGFASEVDKLSKFYDGQAAAAERLELERHPPEEAAPAGGPGTALLVGGGAAVAGAGVLLALLR